MGQGGFDLPTAGFDAPEEKTMERFAPTSIMGFTFGIKLFKSGRDLAKGIMDRGSDEPRA